MDSELAGHADGFRRQRTEEGNNKITIVGTDPLVSENGRTAIEPVLMLGVSLLQYMDGMPDRQAVEMLRYHAGWNFALNRQLGDPVFHPTSLVLDLFRRGEVLPKGRTNEEEVKLLAASRVVSVVESSGR